MATSNIELLRKLFIDLNKHANKVNRAREILLDDRDPHSVCVRALVSNELSGDLSQLEAAQPSMPLSLVDWHTEQAKFDAGPFLTTILGLDWIVGRILASKPIKDFTDYRAIKKQIDSINSGLDLSLVEASKRIGLRLSGTDLTPFAYTPNELETIADAFAKAWTPTLCNLLTKFQPYKDFIALRENTASLSLDFQHWHELYNKAQSDRQGHTRSTRDYHHLLNRLKHRSHNPLELGQLREILDRLEEYKSSNLAFNVVFQRAYTEAFLEYNKIGSDDIIALLGYGEDDLDEIDFENYDFDSYDEPPRPIIEASADGEGALTGSLSQRTLERSNEFIYALNELSKSWPNFLDVDCTFEVEEEGNAREIKLWLGTLLKPDGGIDFTQGASTRAKDLLFLVGALYIYDDQTDPEPGSDFDRFWSRCQDTGAPALCKRAKRAIDRLSGDKPGSAATRILLARDGRFDPQRAQDEIYLRLRKIWHELGL